MDACQFLPWGKCLRILHWFCAWSLNKFFIECCCAGYWAILPTRISHKTVQFWNITFQSSFFFSKQNNISVTFTKNLPTGGLKSSHSSITLHAAMSLTPLPGRCDRRTKFEVKIAIIQATSCAHCMAVKLRWLVCDKMWSAASCGFSRLKCQIVWLMFRRVQICWIWFGR